MRFNEEKKKSIILYLLEKIEQKVENPSQIVSEMFGINRNTVHNYINQMVKENAIKRIKRGKYELVNEVSDYFFLRKKGELVDETDVYEQSLKKHIADLPTNVQEIWEYAFSEIVNNVIDHSNSTSLFVLIERNYINTTVGIGDDGVGIFEKIKNYFNLTSLDDAICELFKGKLTTDKDRHSGEGIFFSSKLMDDFAILSSNKIFANNKFDSSKIIDAPHNKKRGTFVIMVLSNYTHKKSKEVFDVYTDVNGDFSKSIIPLKNIFDGSPVSRSQARRVLSSLEKFEEVILDFDGVEWMGQGFAHQVFVLYNNQVPGVKLIPINMNEDVTKMYNHVINTK